MVLYSNFAYGSQFFRRKKQFEIPILGCREICKINTVPFSFKHPVYCPRKVERGVKKIMNFSHNFVQFFFGWLSIVTSILLCPIKNPISSQSPCALDRGGHPCTSFFLFFLMEGLFC